MWTVIIAAALLMAPGGGDGNCYSESSWTAMCTNSGSQVDISAGSKGPGSASAHSGGDDTSPPSNDSGGDGGSPRHTDDDDDDHDDDGDEAAQACGPLGCRGNYTVATVPEVTLADLESFRPAKPTLTGEPIGFAVVGMPANLVAAASEQLIPGTVLGWDVTVRFRPVGFVFEHGDGTSAVATTGGASWASLGLAQFTPTETSHVYARRGRFAVSVTVQYEASVDFGSGTWRPVPGVVAASAGGYGVEVVEARTALVERTCDEAPHGLAC